MKCASRSRPICNILLKDSYFSKALFTLNKPLSVLCSACDFALCRTLQTDRLHITSRSRVNRGRPIHITPRHDTMDGLEETVGRPVGVEPGMGAREDETAVHGERNKEDRLQIGFR